MPHPTSIFRSIDRQLQRLRECILQGNNIHDTTPSRTDSFSCLNNPLDGLELVQKMHKRSPYGPDYPYLHIDYPNMDGLIYRMWDPDPSLGQDAQSELSRQYMDDDQSLERAHYAAVASFSEYQGHQPKSQSSSEEYTFGVVRTMAHGFRPANHCHSDGIDDLNPLLSLIPASEVRSTPSNHHWIDTSDCYPLSTTISFPEIKHSPSDFFRQKMQQWDPEHDVNLSHVTQCSQNNYNQINRQNWKGANLVPIPDNRPVQEDAYHESWQHLEPIDLAAMPDNHPESNYRDYQDESWA